jgi:hypothetical protein
MKLVRFVLAALISISSFAAVPPALAANVVTGSMWHVPDAQAQEAVLDNIPLTAPDVVFSVVSPLEFAGTRATVAAWLASGDAFNIIENTPGTLVSRMSNSTIGSIFRFTGMVSVTNGQEFEAEHSDGLTLLIGGIDLGFNPSGPYDPEEATATYSGPTGTFAFDLIYADCCSSQAVLEVNLPLASAIPEADSYAMMLAGLGMIGFLARRKKKVA